MGETRTPAKTPSTSRKSGPASTPASASASASSATATRKQQSILGFFAKSSPSAPAKSTTTTPTTAASATRASCLQETTKSNSLQLSRSKKASNVTPVPSSDAIEPSSSQENHDCATVTPGNKVTLARPPFVLISCLC